MTTTQIYHVFIRATAEEIWEAITRPEHTVRYFYGARIDTTAQERVNRGPDGSDWGTEAVLEFDPPRRLVHEWRSGYDEELAAEPASRVTWEISPRDDGTSDPADQRAGCVVRGRGARHAAVGHPDGSNVDRRQRQQGTAGSVPRADDPWNAYHPRRT